MDRRDKALLDKQLWGVDPHPPGLMGLVLVAVFVGGIVIGSVLFARDYKQARVDSSDVTGSISAQKPLAHTSKNRPPSDPLSPR
jgi:hypothetical protein